MKRIRILLLLFICGLGGLQNVQSQISEEAKLTASDPSINAQFGGRRGGIDIEGEYAVVGSNFKNNGDGAAYIYQKDNNCNWVQIQKLLPNPQNGNGRYGSYVSIYQDFIAVGSFLERFDENNLNPIGGAGAVYIYRNISGVWTFVQKIVAGDRKSGARFGISVDISGNNMIIGAEHDRGGGSLPFLTNAGAAYIFQYNGTAWNQTQKIVTSDRDAEDYFGGSVSISNNYAVVGAQLEDDDALGANALSGAGSAYVFEKNGGVWVQVKKLVSADREVDERFGTSVGVENDLIIVGAPYDNHDVNGISVTNAGAISVFRRDNVLGWVDETKLVANDRGNGDKFGFSLDISGTDIVVGAIYEDHDVLGANTISSSGSAYLFKYNGASWNQSQKIVASDRAFNDLFGSAVAIDGGTIIVGAVGEDNDKTGNSTSGAGAAYIFADTNKALTFNKTVLSNGPFFPGDQIVYSFTVENTSSSLITNIVFEDVFPGNIIPSGFISLGLSVMGATLTSDPFDLSGGAIRSFSIQVTINPNMTCGTINNCASITAADCVPNLPITDCESIYVSSSSIPIPNGSADATYCFGDPMADLTASLSSPAGSLHWYDGMTGPAPFYQGSTNSFTPIHTAPGVYNYLVVELVGSCISAPDTITVTIESLGWQQVAGSTVNVDEQGEDVQVDENENVYITGGCGNNAVFGSLNNVITINGPGFLAKYDRCGVLLWVNSLPKAGKSIILDDAQATINVTGGGDQFGFLANYTSNGLLNWSNSFMSFIGNDVVGTSIDIDNVDNIYVTGYYREDVTFNTQIGNGQTISAQGQRNGFLIKYSQNGQLLEVENLESDDFLTPRGITVDGDGDFVYVGGSYRDGAFLAGPSLSGSGEFVSIHETSTLEGIDAINLDNSFGWSDMSPLQELDWDKTQEVLYAVGGRGIGSISSDLSYSDWFVLGTGGEQFFDIDYEEASDQIFVCGLDDATSGSLVAQVDVYGNGFNWRLLSTNTVSGGVDISRGVATNGNTYSNNGIRNVYVTGEYVGDIVFPNSTQSFANGIGSDIFAARVQDKNVTGVFHREKSIAGITEDSEALEVKIYPNPFSESFSIDLQLTEEEVTIEIMDIRGKLILRKENVRGDRLINLNLSEIDNGIYLVKVNQKDKSIIQKVIKQ